jgi:hypothetical protein
MPNRDSDIVAIVHTFASQLAGAVEAAVTRRVQNAVAQILGAGVKRGPGRPPRNGAPSATAARARKKPPKQLCPVPGCKNPAAPVFGMVCAQHKNVPKAKIKEYRERRRKMKEKGGRRAA